MEIEAAEPTKAERDAIGEQEQESVPKRIRLDAETLAQISREDLVSKWIAQDAYLDILEKNRDAGAGTEAGTGAETKENEDEVAGLRESEAKLQLQQQESTRRENVLVMRLATKEHEMQDLMSQVHELKQGQSQTMSQLRSMLLDPAVNVLFQKMQAEISELKSKVSQAQDDLSAWKFTPDSVTGKKLMAKCRSLVQENQDLGKQLSQGRIAQLESELALQKQLAGELKTSQAELTELIVQLEEEVEVLGGTVLFLRQQLRQANEKLKTFQSGEEMETDTQPEEVAAEDGILNGNGMGIRRSCDSDDMEASPPSEAVDKKRGDSSISENPLLQTQGINDDEVDRTSGVQG